MPLTPVLTEPLLEVNHLSLDIVRNGVAVSAVQDLSFTMSKGETLALVGESGCGKSLSAQALMRLLPPAIRVREGEVCFQGESLFALPEYEMRRVRGKKIGMIFQEPATSLNPVMTIGNQIVEVLSLHQASFRQQRRALWEQAEQLLHQVGIADPKRRLEEYPFQLSGGMKQRIMIAIALAGEPELLIADEPTTALDVTVQFQILDLLESLQAERGMAILLITHDLGVVARMAKRVGVMYAGQLLEVAEASHFFANPQHPYSRALFAALPDVVGRQHRLQALPGQVPSFLEMPSGCRFADRCTYVQEICRQEAPELRPLDSGGGKTLIRCHRAGSLHFSDAPSQGALASAEPVEGQAVEMETQALLSVNDLKVHFPVRKGLLKRVKAHIRAVDGVSFSIAPGQTLALVGESGCGKTTVGKALMQLLPAEVSGQAEWRGQPLFAGGQGGGLDRHAMMAFRQQVQMVFQDPFASLNPRMTVGDLLVEGMLALRISPSTQEALAACAVLFEQVGLEEAALNRYPHEFSGGQRQRIAIARALAVRPQLLICDEPTSALDVSVQAQILNLLRELQQSLGLSYLFITHNFSVVDYLAHEVAVMYLGKIVEQGPVTAVLSQPAHPYTEALLSAIPKIEGGCQAIRLEGEIPSPAHPPDGCYFHPRCPKALAMCKTVKPQGVLLQSEQLVFCHLYTSS